MSETPAPSVPLLLPLGPLLRAIGDKTRWRILRLLSGGEPLTVTEIAQGIGLSASATGKHLAVLRKAGVAQIWHGRLQQIPKQFLLDPSARLLDFGYFQLRLGVEEP